jgi:hypothetical protein
MVLKKMDALEFVQSLEGGWDTIIWDPPYFEEKNNGSANKFVPSERKNINIESLEEIKKLIDQKSNNYNFVEFYFKPKNCDKLIIWIKDITCGMISGDKIQRNLEYININLKDNFKANKPIMSGIYLGNYLAINNIKSPLEKPIKLYEKLFKYLNPSKVLDCFAGSYNSAKACNRLNIKIDACDKYLEVPYMKKSNLLNY